MSRRSPGPSNGHWLKFPAVRPLSRWLRDTTETGLTTASETVDGAEEDAAPRPGPVLRLKRLLTAPLRLLRRLRRPGAETEAAAAGTPAGAPAWRRLLPYGGVLLAGAVAGGGAGYWLSAHALARQAAALDAQQAEIARLKGLLAGYDSLILQHRKKLEAEQGRRVELENRLAMAQAELTRPPLAAGRGKAAPATIPARAGDCTLRGSSIGDALKGCLSEFNRP